MTDAPSCWCGRADLIVFGPGYLRCPACETLVSARMPGPEIERVTDESRDLYGRNYWFAHQEATLGLPSILARSRSDLPERGLHWLRTVLKYRHPPGRVLELGSGHGGFVALLRWAGFEATGLEISPWVVEFARETFGVPMLLGPVEDQQIAPASLDMVVLMDVLEHLRDPARTIRHCLDLLRPEGMLLVQTPCYPEGRSHPELVAGKSRFLEVLQPDEHLYLFSRRSIADLFASLGAGPVAFEPAIFADYDMSLVVSRAREVPRAAPEGERALDATPAARLVQALLDAGSQLEDLQQRHVASEEDRGRRLRVIEEQGRRLGEAEAARNNLAAEAAALRRHLDVAEADRAARLETILERGRRLAEMEAKLKQLVSEIAVQREQMTALTSQLWSLQRALQEVQRTRVCRLVRKLGRWTFLDQVGDETAPALPGPEPGPVERPAEGTHAGAPAGESRSESPATAPSPLVPRERTGAGTLAPSSTLRAYRESIGRFNAAQANSELLDSIRGYNHRVVDDLNAMRPLPGTLLLDLGASPHGYALERALEVGATLYVGIGLDIARPERVVGDRGNVGLLLAADGIALPFPPAMFDVVLSMSTLEHVRDVDAVLAEIARVLVPRGNAFLTFEPIWSCSYGHRLHHFGDCARLIPPWAHLTRSPEQMRELLAGSWPDQAPLALEEAIEWIYSGPAINRLTVRDFRERFRRCPLEVEWVVDLREEVDPIAVRDAADRTGLSPDELATRGLSVLLRKRR